MGKLLRNVAVFTALLLAGCTTTNTNGNPLPGFGDTLAPTIAVAGITDAATVHGTVAISAAASDNTGVVSFTLKIDGTQVATASSGVLAYSWVTTSATNGAHALVFTASDAAVNVATTTLNVTVSNTSGGGGNATVSGTVFAPNGTDPISNALIFVQDHSTAATGDPPTDPYLAYTYSAANGTFTLTGVPTGGQDIEIKKGPFTKVVHVDVQSGDNMLGTVDTTLPSAATGGAAEILVVTGNYDSIENVLAKLGLGTLNASHLLTLGTETFDMCDGNSSLPDADYPNFTDFFAVPSNYAHYRTIFLNCGNTEENAFFTNSAAVAGLKAWVEGGGHLYCTDWSYNFVEQIWPDKVDFATLDNNDGLSTTPEARDLAKVGAEISTLNCHIEDSGLAAWMSAIGASSTGDLFPVTDWLPAWVPVDAVDTAHVKVWATGTPPTDALRPMTLTFSAGSGVVLFSSYHTEETPSATLTPQERVLQYLIFEVL